MKFFLAALLATGAVYAENYVSYCDGEEVEVVGMIDKGTYREAVKQLPICCVDVFLYDPLKQTYLMILRNTAPGAGKWWLPGGRLFKGESFYDCAMRKCKQEAGVEIVPLAQLGTTTTVFPDSAWGCQTHTVNTVVLAKVKDTDERPKTDSFHEDFAWRPLDAVPEDPYIRSAYEEALKWIRSPML
ncbi:MAG TPA: NUDIX hydrolase [Chlamydiales bacterium]|nr:NUDIX hydrolase [Chlamydiales bacterium]